MNRVYKFIIFFVLIQSPVIIQTNLYYHIVDSSESEQKQFSHKNLKISAEYEYYEKSGTIQNTTFIQIELSDLSWNITEIELNFINISQHRKLRTIEGNISVSSLKELYYRRWSDYIIRYGQQINFSESTEVYGVYLYGVKSVESTEIVNVELRGFDDNDYKPNETIYITQSLNISNIFGWYYQDFSSSPPVILNNDEYYFLINGEDLYGGESDTRYYFGYNIKSPTYPSLWECETNNVVNKDDYETYQGQPLLCKIVQRVNKTYFPKELNMQGLINDKYYDIINGSQLGEGNLSLTNLNFKPDNIYFDVPITINDSTLEIIYNLSYYIKLRKPLSVIIIEMSGNDSGSKSKTSMGIPPEFFYITVILIIISFITALTSYQAIKKTQIKRRRYREKFYNKYMDILNLDYIFVSDKNSGINVYEQIISDKKLDPTLVSGFLQAISSFGIELTGSDEQFQTIKLEYQKSKILMSEFKNYRIISIFADNPSKEFTDSLDPLSHDIDKYFGKLIENFDGDITQLQGIKELLEKHLQITLIYPLKIVISKEVKLNKSEKSIVNHASHVMKNRNLDHFFVSYLMSEREFNPKRAEIILNLINKKVFQPII